MIFATREMSTLCGGGGTSFQKPAGFEEDDIKLLSYDGAEVIRIRHTTAQFIKSSTPLPAIFHIHGGGLVTGTSRVLGGVLATLSRDCVMPVFIIEYRLAPEYKAPAPLEDCYASLKYLIECASELNINPAKIVVMGESAGGGLSAALTLLARDRALKLSVARQILIYPMLDDRTELPPDAALSPFLV
jgi:acetyl esterase/lipase